MRMHGLEFKCNLCKIKSRNSVLCAFELHLKKTLTLVDETVTTYSKDTDALLLSCLLIRCFYKPFNETMTSFEW